MTQRRALIDTVKDPVVKNEMAENRSAAKPAPKSDTGLKILLSLAVGFACGLLTGRFIKII